MSKLLLLLAMVPLVAALPQLAAGQQRPLDAATEAEIQTQRLSPEDEAALRARVAGSLSRDAGIEAAVRAHPSAIGLPAPSKVADEAAAPRFRPSEAALSAGTGR